MIDFQPTVPGHDPTDERAGTQRLAITFTGSGSEYFRIWIVNLLLIVVTVGLYYPWAKVRRLRYFHGNTLVGGHALDFHGEPKKMLRGFLLVAVMLGLYSVASRASPTAGLVALGVVALLWPALLRAAMQFRLANTSWRGLRLRFDGDLPGAYAAILPLFLPGLGLFALPLMMASAGSPAAAATFTWMLLGLMLASVAALPWLMWRLKRYQHGHMALGEQQTVLTARVGGFYRVAGMMLLVVLSTAFAAGVLTGLFGGILGASGPEARRYGMAVLPVLIIAVVYLAALLTAGPYYVSRMQNLLWNHTHSQDLRFESTLRFRPLAWLSAKNLLLMLLTLGLYWPFARVALARMRLGAVSISCQVDPDSLWAQYRGQAPEATGDAAGDLFGIDLGL